jgi:phosphoribosylanthranilate isomerase
MVKVKICGIKSREDAALVCRYGADYLGFIFINGTPRCLKVDEASAIIKDVSVDMKDGVFLAGLFLNKEPEEVSSIVLECGLGMAQLQGEESPDDCAKVKKLSGCLIAKTVKVTGKILSVGPYVLSDYDMCDFFVFDTFHPLMAGGTGQRFDWKIAQSGMAAAGKPFFVAGGLNPGNVAEAVREFKPYGVDVSSGVEIDPGKKDKKLLKEFIENAKARQ